MDAGPTEITQIISIMQDFGIWIIFAWLYVQEKKSHQVTREQYREDLREIANLRHNLSVAAPPKSDISQAA